ncbi:hypothetical protein N7452_010211 [Penicillium brevicompactum]|uniref:BZIP domain-containing protein n=1 Tax=Penicillium brevicompactum TaxID=5074 RepID=A0A9W9QA33_PENBR|nr:hypothetical protein N7452_010211 [Penicillium brevicompactum]
MASAAQKPTRKRGRPRTATNDEEVPERRRQQLRLAQQAYRKRKETTIGNLQSRVQQLETGVENLSDAFLSFSNLLLDQPLLTQNPHVASALQDITQQCVALAKTASEESSGALARVNSPVKIVATLDNPPPSAVPDLALSDSSTDVEDVARPHVTRWSESPPIQDLSSLPFGLVMTSPTVQFPYLTPPLSSSPREQGLLPSDIGEQQHWNIAQSIVKTCCRHGYQLLVESPSHPKVQQIFGSMLSLSERNHLISVFHAVGQDRTGNLIDSKANVLTALRMKLGELTIDQPQISPRIWQIALESASGDWMDANGVRTYLYNKQIIVENFSDSAGGLLPDVSSILDISKFIKLISNEPICIGNGPAFRRQSVEKAIRMSTINTPWDLNDLYEL